MISTKGRYALRVMVDLAEQDGDSFIPLEEIAKRQHISKKYLEAIIKSLVQNKLLQGHRGKGGGYRLTRKPSDYNVYEILELTEGSMAVVACLEPGSDICERRDSCVTLPMWSKFNDMIHDYFSGISLEELVEQSKKK